MPRQAIGHSEESVVQVGWGSDTHVQVGIEMTDGRNLVISDSSAEYTGIWATLNREDCNQLIRVLRRARDAAFGADA